jgi:hypothetical protein
MSWDVRRISALSPTMDLQRDMGAGRLSGLDHVALLVPMSRLPFPSSWSTSAWTCL